MFVEIVLYINYNGDEHPIKFYKIALSGRRISGSELRRYLLVEGHSYLLDLFNILASVDSFIGVKIVVLEFIESFKPMHLCSFITNYSFFCSTPRIGRRGRFVIGP